VAVVAAFAGFGCGYYLTVISPFTSGTGGYYMQGIIICAGAALF